MKRWWGTFSCGEGDFLEKRIGPLLLALRLEGRECQVFYEHFEDWREGTEDDDLPETFRLEKNVPNERYVVEENTRPIILLPSLADRSVVAQPAMPFYIPTGKETTIFVSTPLWVKIAYGTEEFELNEVPIFRPSDTWFGPDTMEGEICYASQTNARMSMENVSPRIHRAVTPIVIRNESHKHLLLERISLPVPFLGIFETDNDQLWTQVVKMTKGADDETADMEIQTGPPAQIAGAKMLCGARKKISGRALIRKISGFFA